MYLKFLILSSGQITTNIVNFHSKKKLMNKSEFQQVTAAQFRKQFLNATFEAVL
jgi:hypothetical protein